MHLPTGQMGASTANTGASHAGERIFSPVRSTIDRTQPPQGPLYRAAAPVSLSKKSFVNFFDCACERVFCRKAKYKARKTRCHGFFGRSPIQFEAGLAPSSSPAALSRQLGHYFLTASHWPLHRAAANVIFSVKIFSVKTPRAVPDEQHGVLFISAWTPAFRAPFRQAGSPAPPPGRSAQA